MRSAETTLGLLGGVTPQEFRIAGEPIDALECRKSRPGHHLNAVAPA